MHKRMTNRSLHGDPDEPEHEEYPMPRQPGTWWNSVTDVPCPVPGCGQTIVWWEAGYVPGYRVCMRRISDESYAIDSVRHRFLAATDNDGNPVLIRDQCCESTEEA